MYHAIDRCRICGNAELHTVLNLGEQHLTGVFPRSREDGLTRGPLELVKCHGASTCGLLQLRHSYEPTEMYGQNYGYRSSLNKSMTAHLGDIVRHVWDIARPGPGDVVLDIGSNDGTTLGFYPENGPTLVGIDPTAAKFRRFYRPDIMVVPDFFTAKSFRAAMGSRRAKVVTSIAMFYDMESPLDFMREVAAILADNGIWHFEQSYLLSMIRANAYDTVCHEHLEYYGLRQIKWMADRVGLKIIDVQQNDVNGGSFAVTVAKESAPYTARPGVVARTLADEVEAGLDALPAYHAFRGAVESHRQQLMQTLSQMRSQGKRILGYGASTKGNVILQYCNLTPAEIPAIADVNPDKWGCVAPGSWIPIISEEDAHALKPDVLLVLPWHFRANLVERESAYLARGGAMLFPLPQIEVVRA